MFCPQCGQQQISAEVKFCSRCGLPLTAISTVIAHGGNLPAPQIEPVRSISPKRKGVRQGGILLLAGIPIVSLLGVLTEFNIMPEVLVAIAAVLCFVGGPIRMIYAALFEEGAKPHGAPYPVYVQTPSLGAPPRAGALPPQPAAPQPLFAPPRVDTAEIYRPPSVTEGTTRLLDSEKEPKA